MTGSSTRKIPLYRTLTWVWKAGWFHFHTFWLAIPQRVWTVKLLSILARIQRSRVLYTSVLGVNDGGRIDGNSNKLSSAERMQKPDFQVIAAGASLLEWRDIRRIRSYFPTNAQELCRLKSNSSPLCNWASHDLSCPDPACPPSFPAMASHVFWNCPSARRHWKYILERWQKLGDLTEVDLHA